MTGSKSPLPPARLSLVALLVSLGAGFNFGYQLLITNPAQEAFIDFLNKTHSGTASRKELEDEWGIIVSTLFWGMTIGAFAIQKVADDIGRKRGLVLSFFLQAVAMAMSAASYFVVSKILYTVARVFLGIANSISLGIGPLFIAECSPVACRGVISLATGIMIQSALVVGAIAAMPELWGTPEDWWKLYAAEMIMTVVVTLLTAFIHESPEYLHCRKRFEQAKKSLVFYRNLNASEATTEIAKMDALDTNVKPDSLIAVLKNRSSRFGTLMGCFIMTSMTLCGIAAINAFAYEILLSVGLQPLQASIGNVIICLMTVFGVLGSSTLVDRWGRRPLLITTFGILAIANLIICVCMYLFALTKNQTLGWCVVVTICFFNFVFCLGPGPVCFFITPELVTQRSRGAACTWVNVTMNVVRSILLVLYFPVKELLGGPLSYGVLFIPPCLIAVAVLAWKLPETKGKSPEEVHKALFNDESDE